MEFAEKHDFVNIIFLSLILTLWAYWLWTRKELYAFAFRFPGLFGFPIFGVIHRLKSLNNVIFEIGKMFKDCKSYTICTWMGLRPVIMTADPAFIKDVLSSNDLLNKAQPLYVPIYEAFKGGIIASPASEWHRNRRLINPSFHQKLLTSFFPIFNKSKDGAIQKFCEMANSGQEYHIGEELQRVTLGITVETTMGKKMEKGDEVSEDLVKAYVVALEAMPTECIMAYIHLNHWYARFTKSTKEYIHKFIMELLNRKLSQISSTKVAANLSTENSNVLDDATSENGEFKAKIPNIFVDHALNLFQEGKMSYHDVIGEANTIVTAAFETSANGLLSTLLMLAMHPSVQDRLYEEIVNVFPEKSFYIGYEHFASLPYLDMVVNETLRLMPSVPMIGRQVVQNTTLSNGLELPKGFSILISIFDVHRRTDIWGPNAHKFNPDNFLPENLEGKHPYAYMPFSKGMRNCIGWKYALMAIKVLLAGFVRNFSFSTTAKLEDLKFSNNISLKYTFEPKLTIKHRKD
ncbi:probable cytochrome P450 313a4 [Anastrepha ludens]|uniref:probable cytochrome P450 313a4 n=1 Tax=Anastrepha ludens TaxID=28586 RepID=UPI0023B18EBF|nr:probable cytochrome P450 313a4 [Anastrepha ludens]